MRVIGGVAKGRRLGVPKGRAVRPTSDRVREALFASLGDVVDQAVVLDLFAGTGALAIEALSRGARRAVLVERDPKAAAVVAENLERTGLGSSARLARMDAARFCLSPGEAFDLVLVDPPYTEPATKILELLDHLHGAGGLAPGAVVVLERDRRDTDLQPPFPAGLVSRRVATYGDTVLHYLEASRGEATP
ncbi:MAG: 16S rRNA (guanine(966)-N(2))-methyltransferase RsmD [Egibacteraceae bacterium]